MEFLLSTEGLVYNIPALLVLVQLLWKRPHVGVTMALLAALRVGGPILDFGVVVPFSVHATLGSTTCVSWNRGDWGGNVLLTGFGLSLVVFTYSVIGWLLPDTAAVQDGVQRGLAVGLMVGAVRALINGGIHLQRSHFD